MLHQEIKSLIQLAAPVSLAQLSLIGMSATDVLIAGQAGTEELAGMNLGVNAWNMVILFFAGIGFATQPLVAHHFGARNDSGIKDQLHQSLWMCFGLGIIATVVVWVMAWAIGFARYEEGLQSIGIRYLYTISLCAIPLVMLSAARGTLEGMGLTKLVFFVNFTAFLINIPLDYILVHGLYGFPMLGAVGCAWATVVLTWSAFFACLSILNFHPSLTQRSLFARFRAPDQRLIGKTLNLGLPIGASIAIELSMFSGAGMLIASFGAIEAGAHAVAITVASMSFMIYVGLAQGVTIRASQFIGSGDHQRAWYTVKVGTYFNLSIAALICITFVLFTEPLIRLFSNDNQVIRLGVILLYYGAAFQLADCLQVSAMCALRAYRDTSTPPKYQLVSFILIGLPLGYGLAFYEWWPGVQGAQAMWLAMVVSLSIVGLLLARRLAHYRPAEPVAVF